MSINATVEEHNEKLSGSLSAEALRGYSAYQVAVANGFEGTEEEWIESLKGDKGDKGETGPQGPQGEKGDTGETGPQGETDLYIAEYGVTTYDELLAAYNAGMIIQVRYGYFVYTLTQNGANGTQAFIFSMVQPGKFGYICGRVYCLINSVWSEVYTNSYINPTAGENISITDNNIISTNYTIKSITQADYDSIVTKDENTLYVITED